MLRAGQFSSAERIVCAVPEADRDARAWVALGIARHALGKTGAAREALQRALVLDPGEADAHFNLGVVAEAQRDPAAAKACYEAALRAQPAHTAARQNLAATLLELGDPDGALREIDRLLAEGCETADILTNRARALFAAVRDEEALAAAERAHSLAPAQLRPRMDRVIGLSGLGRIEEAEKELAELRHIAGPRFEGLVGGPARSRRFRPRALWVARLFQQQSVGDWRERAALIDAVRRALVDPSQHEALADPGVLLQALGLPLQASELRQLGGVAMKEARLTGAQISASLAAHRPPPVRKRLRVGFLAAGLREHPESYLMRRVYCDRDRDRFEHYLYALNPDDGSSLRREIESAVDRFREVSNISARDLVAQLRADELDLLVDQAGANVRTRPEVVAAGVAPLHVGYLGTPTTLGPAFHDYRISDAETTPAHAGEDWHERLALVPAPFATYDDSLAGVEAGTRAAHGLPEGLVLCAMHQLFKIEPDVFAVWMRLLRAFPGAVLWLLDDGARGRENLCREAARGGVAPERLVFAPRVPLRRHLGRMQHADLFLDTFYCNAHTTALDALWAGVPVLTREGDTMASRMCATYARAAGLSDLVGRSVEEYETTAVELARDRARLGELKRRLVERRASAPAFRTIDRVRALERAFTAMVERNRAGLPPATLTIG